MSLSVYLAWASIGIGLVLLSAAALFDVLWRFRARLSDTVCAFVIVAAIFIVGDYARLGFAALTLYFFTAIVLCFLAARMRHGSLPEDHVRHSTFRSCLYVLTLYALLLPLQLYGVNIQAYSVIAALLLAALVLAFFFAVQALLGLRRYVDRETGRGQLSADPPTVSLAVPARNETHALTRCLEAALASDYPRLEILVLDDCSYDKTSGLIRSFAHEGVRFVQGDAPADGWLGKNNAYATLLEQATGKYVFFMGVDTMLEPEMITRLVRYAEKNQLDMVSVLPRQQSEYMLPLLMQNLRYVWEIVLPRHQGREPVSPESWLVNRQRLIDIGGFDVFKQAILPERSIATHEAIKQHYRFMIAGTTGVTYGKKWSSQTETAIRLWYPSCGMQPFAALALSAAILAFGFGPFAVLLLGGMDDFFITLLAGAACFLYLSAYAATLFRLQPHTWWLSVWLLPAVLVQEAGLVLASMGKYEFGSVHWKGRNICYPLLHAARSNGR